MQELKPGFSIGSYRVLRELGKGGMGAVYEVEHVTLGVHYALKTFRWKRPTPSFSASGSSPKGGFSPG